MYGLKLASLLSRRGCNPTLGKAVGDWKWELLRRRRRKKRKSKKKILHLSAASFSCPMKNNISSLRNEDQESPEASKSSKIESLSVSQQLLDEDDEDVIPPTPPPASQAAKKRKRSIKVKKLKDRTYMDDEGCFVTEKVTKMSLKGE